MNSPLEPPRLLLDEAADPLVRQLLHSTREDGPSSQRLLLAPVAIAAMLGTQTLTQSAAASAVVASAKTAATSAAAVATSAGVSGTVGSAAGTTSSTVATGALGTASASLASSLAALPALTKSLLIGLSVGGAIVATVPVPRQPLSSPKAVHTAEQLPPVSLGTEHAHRPEPAPFARATAEWQPGSPSAASISSKAESERNVPRLTRKVSEAKLAARQHDDAASLELAPPDISREVALLDAARLALGRNDALGALQELEQYQLLSRRTLDPEATVLRVRALLASDRRQDAAALARAFTLRAPNAPQTRLLKKLTSTRDFADPNQTD